MNKVNEILMNLEKAYPKPVTELKNWKNPMQFMVSVILSAQATDKGVNKVTPELFKKYITVNDFSNAKLKDIENAVKSINYYKTKAKRIIDAANYVKEHYKGEIPKTIEKLIKIPGIGRKSANVILQEVFEISEGIVVDTHVTRVSNRFGFTSYKDQKDAEKIEMELQKIIPKDKWRMYSSATVLHGRYICKAKKPNCEECKLNKVCPSAFKV